MTIFLKKYIILFYKVLNFALVHKFKVMCCIWKYQQTELGVRLQNNVASRACASFSNGVASRAIAHFSTKKSRH